MTYEQFKSDFQKANLEKKFDPANCPPDEDMIKWIWNYFNELNAVTIEQVLKNFKVNDSSNTL